MIRQVGIKNPKIDTNPFDFDGNWCNPDENNIKSRNLFGEVTKSYKGGDFRFLQGRRRRKSFEEKKRI